MVNWKEHIKNLSYEVIGEKPIYYNFGEYNEEDQWEIGFELTEEEQENQEYEPIYNYIYPLPDNFTPPEDIRKRLNNTTLIYFHNENKYYLTLTGCGMDLTWEIAETYILLGYYPPIHFCNLPNMADKGRKKDIDILKICNKSLQAMQSRINMDIKHNENLIKDFNEEYLEREF